MPVRQSPFDWAKRSVECKEDGFGGEPRGRKEGGIIPRKELWEQGEPVYVDGREVLDYAGHGLAKSPCQPCANIKLAVTYSMNMCAQSAREYSAHCALSRFNLHAVRPMKVIIICI